MFKIIQDIVGKVWGGNNGNPWIPGRSGIWRDAVPVGQEGTYRQGQKRLSRFLYRTNTCTQLWLAGLGVFSLERCVTFDSGWNRRIIDNIGTHIQPEEVTGG